MQLHVDKKSDYDDNAPRSMDRAFFIPILRENLSNCQEKSQISVNLCPIRACIWHTLNKFVIDSLTYCSILNRLLHIIVDSSQYRGNSGRIQPNPMNIHNCFLPVSLLNRRTSQMG